MAGIERTGARLAPLLRDPASGRFVKVSRAIGAAASRVLAVIRPEMITSDKLTFNVMKAPVTVAMFKQFVDNEAIKPEGYRITGHEADKLAALLADPKKSDHALTYVSYEDAVAFVTWRREKTGEDLRIPTEEEWLAAKREVGSQLTGNLWEWTQAIYTGITRVLRSLLSDDRHDYFPAYRYGDHTLRLVQDK